MGFVRTRNFVEHNLGLCDVLSEKSSHLLNGINILTNDLARFGCDFFAASFILSHILYNCTGKLTACNRKHA